MPEMTTTSYVFLGLLAERPWTTYELAQQVQLLAAFWPRTERQLYEQPKVLVDHGYATATKEFVGKRPRTLYRITPAGRRALKKWLSTPGTDWSLAWEAMVKVFMSDHGTKAQLLTQLEAIRDKNARDETFHRELVAQRLRDRPFAERMHINALVSRFFVELIAAVDRWVTFAIDEVQEWTSVDTLPDDLDDLWQRVFTTDGQRFLDTESEVD